MLVIALDTSTPAVTAGLVDYDGERIALLAEAVTVNPRAHGELLMPQLLDVLAEAGRRATEVDAIVVGNGPGPFTGLRVGLATAAALGHAHGIPVHPVCGLDAIALRTAGETPLLVATDARRRELYWAVYSPPCEDGRRRLAGPHVGGPDEVSAAIEEHGVAAVAGEKADAFVLSAVGSAYPTPIGLVEAARIELSSSSPQQPLTPRYLRRPDATPPGPRKQVTPGGVS